VAANVTVRAMVAASENDPRVREALVDAGKWIGIAAANVVTTLHPQWVILGGGVAQAGEILVRAVREEIHDRVGMFPTTDVRVEQSLLGEQAGLLGALALAGQPVV